MRYPESVRSPRRMIDLVVESLERFGKFDFKTDGYIRIERWSSRRALDAYRSTLNGIKGRLEGETPSATMVSKAYASWSVEKAEIGVRVRQKHVGIIRPEVRPLVENWIKAGKPSPSSGGFYFSVPNKSYARVADLMKYPDLRDVVINLSLQDPWVLFWERYLPLRHDVSRQMLDLVKTGVDPEALSRHNEKAGTGLAIRGMRLNRADLVKFANDLDFLLPYSYAIGVAFAAVQIAKLKPDEVWMVDIYDARIRGAIASRSDVDVTDITWDGERLTLDALAQTR